MAKKDTAQITLSIYRFDPDKDKKPYMKDYLIDLSKVQGQMLLDAMLYIKDEMDSTLSMRRSCGEGVCGSDGMNINGKNGLACQTALAGLPSRVVLRPLPGLPVVRDLIVDMSQFYQQLEKAEPFMQHEGETPDKEHIQMPAERAKLDGLYECILCACCSTACPSFWWNPDKFLGPAALLAAWRFIVDSRDDATAARLQMLDDLYRLYRCHGIMNCVDVCPKGLNPTKAIGNIRKEMLKKSG